MPDKDEAYLAISFTTLIEASAEVEGKYFFAQGNSEGQAEATLLKEIERYRETVVPLGPVHMMTLGHYLGDDIRTACGIYSMSPEGMRLKIGETEMLDITKVTCAGCLGALNVR